MSNKSFNQQCAELSRSLSDLRKEILKPLEPITRPIVKMLACEAHLKQLESVLPPSNAQEIKMIKHVSKGLPLRMRGLFSWHTIQSLWW